MPELISCARERGLVFNKSVKRSQLIALFNPVQKKEVVLPATIKDVVKTLPKLKREYGGIIDFKLDGSFETMSMVPGEATYVKGTDVPDYEVMWHNHPEVLNPGYISTPSLGDTISLIKRKHTQYSLIFTDKGTYVQWVPDRHVSKQYLKLFLSSAKKTVNRRVDREASEREALSLFSKIIYSPRIRTPFMEQLIQGIRTYFKVETAFIPWDQDYEYVLNIVPYEPTIHRGRLTKGQKAKAAAKS